MTCIHVWKYHMGSHKYIQYLCFYILVKMILNCKTLLYWWEQPKQNAYGMLFNLKKEWKSWHATTLMNLKDIVLSEIIQSQKTNIVWIHSYDREGSRCHLERPSLGECWLVSQRDVLSSVSQNAPSAPGPPLPAPGPTHCCVLHLPCGAEQQAACCSSGGGGFSC